MGSILLVLLSAWVGSFGIWLAFARIGQRPALPLPDGSGHVMVHSNLDKCIAGSFAVLVLVGFVAGAYQAWQIASWGLGVYVLVLCVPGGWAAALYLRKQRNRVELATAGLTWRRGSRSIFIAWSDVDGFTEAPAMTTWLVHSRDGRALRVDKLLVGTPTTFLEYLKKYLPPHLYETAFGYIRPEAALRARVKQHASARMVSIPNSDRPDSQSNDE